MLNITLLKNLSFPVQFTGTSLSCGFRCGDLINSSFYNLYSERRRTLVFLTSFFTFDVFLIVPKVPPLLKNNTCDILISWSNTRTHYTHFLFLSCALNLITHIVYLTLMRPKLWKFCFHEHVFYVVINHIMWYQKDFKKYIVMIYFSLHFFRTFCHLGR